MNGPWRVLLEVDSGALVSLFNSNLRETSLEILYIFGLIEI